MNQVFYILPFVYLRNIHFNIKCSLKGWTETFVLTVTSHIQRNGIKRLIREGDRKKEERRKKEHERKEERREFELALLERKGVTRCSNKTILTFRSVGRIGNQLSSSANLLISQRLFNLQVSVEKPDLFCVVKTQLQSVPGLPSLGRSTEEAPGFL